MASSTTAAVKFSRSLDYPKRGGVADTLGQDYEVDICSLLFLRALRLCSDFYLASNHGNAGAFDDAVMVYRLHGEDTYRAILLQAKHKKKTRVTLRTLTGPNNDFSLVKYFSSFLEVSDGWTSCSIGGEELKLQDVVYALYTNAAADLGAAVEDVRDRQHLGQLLLTGGSVVQISYERVKDALSVADHSQLEYFLGRLVFCYGQMSHAEASLYLDEEIRLFLNDQPGNVSEIRIKITEIVRNWWDKPTDTSYLTKDSALCHVNLQGKRMSLKKYDPSVCDFQHIQLLARRPEGEEVVLGQHLPESVPYYVPRVLERKAFLEESFFSAIKDESAIVAVVGIGKEELQKQLGNILTVCTVEELQSVVNSVVVLLPEDSYHDVFRELLCKYECNMYLLTFIEGEFLCAENKGGLGIVRKNIKGKMSDRINTVWNTLYRNVIVEGLPGMGKSCLMSWVGEEVKAANPADWVLRVDLGRLSDKIQQRDFQSFDDIKEFLAEACLANKDPCGLEKALFSHALEVTGNVTILLDAFDEISPDYTERCLRLLQGLARSLKYRQMVVTTRPVTSRVVEDVLGLLSFTLCPFSEDDLKYFFINYFLYSHFKTDEVILTIIGSVGQCLEVPLLAFMAAEGLFLYHYKQGSVFKSKAMVKLYDLFVEKQIMIFLFEKHGLSTTRPNQNQMMGIMKNSLNESLMNLAVNNLLNVEEQRRVGFKGGYEGLKDSKVGLVVTCEEKVEFIHHTFAEFFLGMWLARNFKECFDFLIESLFRPNFKLVRESFDSFLYQECPLHTAVAEGDLPAVARLLDEGLSVSSVDAGGRTPLHVAILSLRSDSGLWSLLVNAGAVMGQKDTVLQWSVLTYAEAMSNWDAVEFLLGRGASISDINGLQEMRRATKLLQESCWGGYLNLSLAILQMHQYLLNKGLDWRGCTALHCAAESGSLSIVRALVDSGADLDTLDAMELTAMSRAAQKGHVDVIDYLKQKGASMEAGKITPLDIASNCGHRDVINYLKYGGNENMVNELNSALIKAAINNEECRVMGFLEKGAVVEHCEDNGMTALHWSAACGNINVVKILLQSGARINATNHKGDSALMAASVNGHTETVQLLLSEGADVNMTNNKGNTALMWASYNGHSQTVQIILREGAVVDMANNEGETALMWASLNGHTDAAQKIISEGADVNMANSIGNTALMGASSNGHTDTVKLILNLGADVNKANHKGNTALMWATYYDHTDTVQIILSLGAVVNKANYKGTTALMWASYNGHSGTVRALLNEGADVNKANYKGTTALMWASYNGHKETVQLILNEEADVNMKNNEGDTALMWASLNGHNETVQLLLREGADVNMANNNGLTALMLASYNGHTDIKQLLLSSGAVGTDAEQDWTKCSTGLWSSFVWIRKKLSCRHK